MNVRKAFVKSRNARLKKKPLKDQMPKDNNTVYTAKELITQQTCARMAQTPQVGPNVQN